MKTKFIIFSETWNGFYKPSASKDVIYEPHQPKTYVVDEVADCFIQNKAKDAYHFDTYEQAETRIKFFSEIKNERKEGDTITFTYPGVGIYKIEKIFVIELP